MMRSWHRARRAASALFSRFDSRSSLWKSHHGSNGFPMKGATHQSLRTARALFRQCAQKLEAKRVGNAPLPLIEREMQIGFGLCADYQRWAAALNELSFSTKAEA